MVKGGGLGNFVERQKAKNGLAIAAQCECNQRCWVDKKLSLLSLSYRSP